MELFTPLLSIETQRELPLVEADYVLGLPKGELLKGSLAFVRSLGWDTTLFETTEKLSIKSPVSCGKVLRLRQKDIVPLMERGDIDMGIIGADLLNEYRLEGKRLTVQKALRFGMCSFYLGFPFDQISPPPGSLPELQKRLDTCRIATSLPHTLYDILTQAGISIDKDQIITLSGSVEAAREFPGDIAIADISDSGTTAQANNIRRDFQLYQFPGAYLVRKYYERG